MGRKAGKRIDEGTRGFDLRSAIEGCYPSLPANQRKVADFLMQHLRDAPFFSVTELERRTGASKATVVRFARRLGFRGFLHFRSTLLQGVQSHIRQPDLFPLPGNLTRQETLTAIAHQDVRNINQTINQIDPKDFHDIARMIVQASHVYTVGLGISSLMSQVLAYSLNQVAVRATAFVHDFETFIEQLPFVTRDDLMIVFSFPPYSRESVEVARSAAAKKIRVVGITDTQTSPVSYHCVRVIPIRSKNRLFTNSITAISVVINALATEVALRNRAKALRALKQVERQLEESGHYTTI